MPAPKPREQPKIIDLVQDDNEQDDLIETSPPRRNNTSSIAHSPAHGSTESTSHARCEEFVTMVIDTSGTESNEKPKKRRRVRTNQPCTPLSSSSIVGRPTPLINAYWVQHRGKWPESLTDQIRTFMRENKFWGYAPGNPIALEAYDRLYKIVLSQADDNNWEDSDCLRLHKKLKEKLEDVSREAEFIRLSRRGDSNKDHWNSKQKSSGKDKAVDRGASGPSGFGQSQGSAFSAASYESIVLHLPFLTPNDLSRVIVDAQKQLEK